MKSLRDGGGVGASLAYDLFRDGKLRKTPPKQKSLGGAPGTVVSLRNSNAATRIRVAADVFLVRGSADQHAGAFAHLGGEIDSRAVSVSKPALMSLVLRVGTIRYRLFAGCSRSENATPDTERDIPTATERTDSTR